MKLIDIVQIVNYGLTFLRFVIKNYMYMYMHCIFIEGNSCTLLKVYMWYTW